MLDVKKIRLILELRESGISDSKILSAIEKIPREKFISENKLQKTTVIDFKDSESKYEYANDSTLHTFRNERDLHYISNGMTMKRSSEIV